jgi:hypothetical protein
VNFVDCLRGQQFFPFLTGERTIICLRGAGSLIKFLEEGLKNALIRPSLFIYRFLSDFSLENNKLSKKRGETGLSC